MPTEYDPYANTDIAKLDARRAATTSYQPSPQTAGNLNSLTSDFPWMPPGVVWGLANANVTGEAANPVAQASLAQSLQGGTQRRAGVKVGGRRFASLKEAKQFVNDRIGSDRGPFGLDVNPIHALKDVAGYVIKQQENQAGQVPLHTPTGAGALQAATSGEGYAQSQAKQRQEENKIAGAGLAPVIRNVAIAGQYPLDLASAAIREEAAHPLGIGREGDIGEQMHQLNEQTYAYQNWVKGHPAGAGLLPSYEPKIGGEQSAAAAQGEAARKASAYLIGGHAWTPGRAIAQGVGLDADSTPFKIGSGLIDATVAFKADPTSALLGAAGELARGARTFETLPDAAKALELTRGGATTAQLAAAGLNVGQRTWIKGRDPIQWLYSTPGSYVVNNLATEKSPYQIWKQLGEKVPPDLAGDLARAGTPEDVRTVLAPHLGTTLDTVPKWRGGINTTRAFTSVPTKDYLPFDDPETFVQQLDRHLVNGRVDAATRQKIFDQYVLANGRGERYAAVDATFEAMKQRLIANGLDEKVAHQMTRFSQTDWTDSKFWIDHATGSEQADMPFAKIGADQKLVPTRHLDSELLAGGIKMPDQTEMRRMTSLFSGLYGNSPEANSVLRAAIGLGDTLMGAWKTSVLVRGAWTLRVIGDEQLRMAATDGLSLFRHPISYLSLVAGSPNDNQIGLLLERVNRATTAEGRALTEVTRLKQAGEAVPEDLAAKAAEYVPAGSRRTDISGATFGASTEDDYNKIITEVFSGMKPTRRQRLPHWTIVDRNSEDYTRGLAEELQMATSSRVARVAATMPPEAAKEWFWSGPGRYWRYQIAEQAKTDSLDDLTLFNQGRFNYSEMHGETAHARGAANAYIDTVYQRLDDLTGGGHDVLMNAIRTGKIGDKTIVNKWGEANKDVLDTLDTIRSAGAGPNNVKAQSYLSAGRNVGHTNESLQRGVAWMFDTLMTKPSNYLSRSPQFREQYWNEIERLAPVLDTKGRAAAMENLRFANLPSDQERNVIKALGTSEKGTLKLDAVDTLAKKRALDSTRHLLYDLHEKSQFFQAARLVFPFGEAWREVLTRWANIAMTYPQTARRLQQGVVGARQAGIFRTDPSTGQEVFTYPGSEWMTNKLIGIPIPLQGTVKGMNLLGNGLPGVGPQMSAPLGAILPNKPQYDVIRKFLFPYGQPTGATQDILWKSFAPSWLQKVATGLPESAGGADPNSDRLFGNTVFDVVRYLASTGEYDLNGDNAHDEMNRLWNDATHKARAFSVIRGIAQSISPSAPAPVWHVEDKSGNVYLVQKLADDFNKKAKQLSKDGDPNAYSTATDWFIDRYGPNALFALQSKSERVTTGITDASHQVSWERNHPDQVSRFPQTWALFAPSGGSFDISAYNNDFSQGQRAKLTPKEMTLRANARIARHILDRETSRLGTIADTAQGRTYLADFRQGLAKDFPGFDEQGFDTRAIPNVVAELERASKDPELARTPAGKGLAEYLDTRDAAISAAKGAGLRSPFTAKKAIGLRAYMRSDVQDILKRYPEFRPMWEQVFSHELTDDNQATATQTPALTGAAPTTSTVPYTYTAPGR